MTDELLHLRANIVRLQATIVRLQGELAEAHAAANTLASTPDTIDADDATRRPRRSPARRSKP
jgi:hypothetical protein